MNLINRLNLDTKRHPKIKVLFITHHWYENTHHSKFSGYQRLVSFMPKNKIESTILTWTNDKSSINVEEGITIIRKKIPKFFKFFFKRLILSAYASKISSNYDLIHALYDDVAPLYSKKPILITIHTIKDLDPTWWLKLKFIFTRIILNKANKIIVLSSNMQDILKNYIDNKKIILIPHGIDTSHFKATPRLRKLRFKEPYRRFKKIFLSVGSYGATDYNLEQIIKKFKDAMFIFIGSKFEPKQKYPNLLIYKNISEERLIEFYSICDYFIKPLRFASANNSILEAMSMGKPIIASDVPGIRTYLGKSGAIYFKNGKDLYKSIDMTILNKLKIKKISRSEFSWENIDKKLVEIYNSTIT